MNDLKIADPQIITIIVLRLPFIINWIEDNISKSDAENPKPINKIER